jgi:hypothetical protein
MVFVAITLFENWLGRSISVTRVTVGKTHIGEIRRKEIASGRRTNDFLCPARHFLSPKFSLISEKDPNLVDRKPS